MIDEKVGRIKNVKYNSDTKEMEVTFVVTDSKFKKKLLRDLSLSGSLKVNGEHISYTGNIQESKWWLFILTNVIRAIWQ